jgi:hypothetical protein
MVLFFASLGGKRSQAALKNDARLEHLPCLKTMQRAHHTQRRLPEIRRPICHKRSHAVPDLHHAHGRQVSDASAEAGTADIERARQLALRRDLVARLQGSVLDQRSNVVDHLHRSMAVGRVLHALRHTGLVPSANPGN